MFKLNKKSLTTAALMLLAGPANAVMLSLNPLASSIDAGDTVTVDLTVSGLGDFAPDSLGAFLVEITFDELLLSLTDVTYGAFLGNTDPLAFETDLLTTSAPGSITLDLVSFLLDFELDALQPSSFSLASLSYTGLAEGTSLLSFGAIDLSDAAFPASTIQADLQAGSITVGMPTQPISAPATLLLVLAGAAGLLVYRRSA